MPTSSLQIKLPFDFQKPTQAASPFPTFNIKMEVINNYLSIVAQEVRHLPSTETTTVQNPAVVLMARE